MRIDEQTDAALRSNALLAGRGMHRLCSLGSALRRSLSRGSSSGWPRRPSNHTPRGRTGFFSIVAGLIEKAASEYRVIIGGAVMANSKRNDFAWCDHRTLRGAGKTTISGCSVP